MGGKVRLVGFVCAALLAVATVAAPAEAARSKRHVVHTAHVSHFVLHRSYSSIVIDAATGNVLEEDNADALKYPASLTKMMTLYMLFEALDNGKLTVATRLIVSPHAASQSPTKLGLEAGERITVRDAILGLVTQSANDAAATVAEALGGTEEHFAELMTARARRLGMTSTTFHNASGLPDPGQTTTARDMVRLSQALIRDFPKYYSYFSTPEFVYAGHKHANHNHLMSWYEGADGIKTGFINAAGFNLAASAIRGNRRIIGVVLGGPSPVARDKYMGKLLDAGFAQLNGLPEVREASATPAPSAKAAKTVHLTGPQVKAAKVAKAKQRRVVVAEAAAMPVTDAAPADKTARAADSERGWAVQVGAFGKIDGARRAAETAIQLAPMLSDAGVEISSLGRRHAMHRARLIGLTASQARDACHLLVSKDRDCLVLSPADLRAPVKVAKG